MKKRHVDLPDWCKLPDGYDALYIPSEKSLIVFNKAVPEARFAFDYTHQARPVSDFNFFLKGTVTSATEEYMRALKVLDEEFGYDVTRETTEYGNFLQLKHRYSDKVLRTVVSHTSKPYAQPGKKITDIISLTPQRNIQQLWEVLRRAQQHAIDMRDEVEFNLEYLRERGFTITPVKDNGSHNHIKITHETYGVCHIPTHNDHDHIDAEGAATIAKIVELTEGKSSDKSMFRLKDEKLVGIRSLRKTLMDIPRHQNTNGQQAIIILDASALNNLCTVCKATGKYYLEALAEIAALPTIKAIIIPSVIADWEMRGRIPSMPDKFGDVVQVDNSFLEANRARTQNAQVIDNLFHGASRVWVHEDEVQFKRGAYPKIMIWNSQAEDKMYQELQSALTIPINSRSFRLGEIRKQHEDIGEEILCTICTDELNALETLAGMNGKGQTFIVSDDSTYFASQDLETQAGYSVGKLSSAGLLNDYANAQGKRFDFQQYEREIMERGNHRIGITTGWGHRTLECPHPKSFSQILLQGIKMAESRSTAAIE